jgi:hypothetical protein
MAHLNEDRLVQIDVQVVLVDDQHVLITVHAADDG